MRLNSIAALLLLLLYAMGPASSQTFTGNAFGITSNDDNIYPAQVLIGGVATPTSTATINVTVGSTTTTFAHIVGQGETLQTVVDSFIAQINASAAMQAAGIWSNQGNPNVPAVGINPRRNGSPVPVVASQATGNLWATTTIQAVNILDAGPIVYFNRAVNGQPPQIGDTVASLSFGGPNSAFWGCCVTAYAGATVIIDDPAQSSPRGRMAWFTSCPNAVQGYVCNVFQFSDQGLVMFGADGAPAAGMGRGTINVPGGYYLNGRALVSQGSFTPTFRGSITVGSPSYYPSNSGTYEIILNQVTARFTLAVSGLGGATGSAQIAGFPTPSASYSVGSCTFQQMSGVTMNAGYTMLGAQIGAGQQTATIVESGSGVNAQGLPVTAFPSGWFVIQGFCSYRAP